jgi:tetratricopeptide (TPR) repeat protein
VTGEFVLISTHGGINFYIGNNPGASGTFTPPLGMSPTPHATNLSESKRIAEILSRRRLTQNEASAFWFRRGLTFIKEYPLAALRLFLWKIRLFCNYYEIADTMSFYFFRRYSLVLRLLPLSFGMVAPLGIMGLLVGFRYSRRAGLLALFALAYALGVVIFFVTSRYRFPLLPVLCPFAGFGLWRLVSSLAEKRYSFSALTGAALGVFALLVNYPLIPESDFAHWHNQLGTVYLNQKRYPEATLEFQRAIQIGSHRADSYTRLGHLHESKNDVDGAIEQYGKAIAANPHYAPAHYSLGKALASKDRHTEAVAAYERAVALKPYMAEAYRELGLSYGILRRFDRAAKACKRATDIDPKDAEAFINLGNAYTLLGKNAAALDAYRRALENDPDSGVGRYNLARLLVKMGRLREALTEAEEAHRLGQARAVGLIHRIRAKLAAGREGGK